MNITAEQIAKLKNYASSILKDRQDLSADDVVQDVILEALESGEPITMPFLNQRVKNKAYRTKLIDNRSLDKPNTFSDKETTKFCKGCNQDLTMGSFSVITNHKNGSKSLTHLCHKCESQRAKKKRKENPEQLKRYNEYHNRYYHRKKLLKEIESKQYLKKAHALLEWNRKP